MCWNSVEKFKKEILQPCRFHPFYYIFHSTTIKVGAEICPPPNGEPVEVQVVAGLILLIVSTLPKIIDRLKQEREETTENAETIETTFRFHV